MANTKIPSELIDGTLGVAGISSSADGTAITIDSSERVSIGHTTANADFQVSNAGAEQIEFYAGNSSNLNATQHYNRSTSSYVDNKIIANTHQFFSGANEVARIDSAGMIIGGTSIPAEASDGTGAAGLLGIGNSSELYPSIVLMSSQRNWMIYQDSSGSYGLYDSSGNDLRYRVDSSGRHRFNSSSLGSQQGTVFIQGASAFACPLQIENTNANGHYMMWSTSGTSRALIGVGSNSGTGDLAHLGIKSHGGQIQFFANNTKHLTLYENGELSAGTSTSDKGHNIINWAGSGYIGLTGDLTGYTAGTYSTLKANGPYIYFDISGTYSAYMASNGSINANSDRRLKENIETLPTGQLDKVCNLRGVNFDWIDERATGTQVGLIAQEVQAEYPELVDSGGIEDGTLTVNYAGLVSPLIEAIKELKTKLEAAEARITELEG